MPFESEKQQRYMWAVHPELARKWTEDAKQQGKPVVKGKKPQKKRRK